MSDMKKCILAVDGGGTFHKAALFCGMELVENSFISVPANSAGTAEEISGAFRNLGREAAAKAEAMGYEIEAVGMCMPGPFDYITPASVPTLLVCGTHDDLVFAENSTRFYEKCRTVGAPCEVLYSYFGGHCFESKVEGKEPFVNFKEVQDHLFEFVKRFE